MLKAFIPKSIRLSIRVALKTTKDIFSGHWFHFARRKESNISYNKKITISQKLKPHPPKVHNIKNAIQYIESIHVMPNEIFSFCRTIGKASTAKGYIPSRSISGSNIEEVIGGGICQLSGLIYYISLIGNLEIIERHNHSMDIYDEQSRFTPLGSDATIVYGYKDLRIKNNSQGPINFKFHIDEENLSIQLNHTDDFQNNIVEFETRNDNSEKIIIDTLVNGKLSCTSVYRKSAHKIGI
ncbi:MAG: vancomycin resistance protein VanW [Saprospiraceae bacterium]|jgi:vancomycin resistance protein VanW